MIQDKSIAVLIPVFNEEKQIGKVLEGLPGFVDRIIVVNDGSTDQTVQVVTSFMEKTGKIHLPEEEKNQGSAYGNVTEILEKISQEEARLFPEVEMTHRHRDARLVLINLKKNLGKGVAVGLGYKWARDHRIQCTAIMDGDGQMDPQELGAVCIPVISGEADYVKGNRLRHKGARVIIPRTRLFGNAILSILTKIASGYWRVSDSQTGYTAISYNALQRIPIYDIYPRYGMPNDMLVKLNIASCTVREVDINPVYDIGESSKLKPGRVIFPIAWLLIRSFFTRLWQKYLFRDFHPLFILYHFSFLLFLIAIPYAVKILRLIVLGIHANPVTILAFIFLFISGFQSFLFAMWMDMLDNERLYK